MDTIYIIGIVVLSVLALILGYNIFKSKINPEQIDESVDKVVLLAKSFLEIVDLGDKFEKNVTLALDLASDVSDYVLAQSLGNEDQKGLALSVIKEVLKEFEIETSESEQNLINIIVQEAIEYINKQSK